MRPTSGRIRYRVVAFTVVLAGFTYRARVCIVTVALEMMRDLSLMRTKIANMHVSVHGAKTQLSKLLDLVEDGESVVIERHGRPVAQLVPMRKRRPSPLGAMRGQFTMTEGWERALSDEEAEAFWGGR